MPPAQAGRKRQRRVPPLAAPARPAPASPPSPSRAASRGGWRWLRWPLLIGIWGSVALALLLLAFAWDLPRPDSLPAATRRPSVTLLAADGTTLATQGDLYGEVVRIRDLPAHLPAALMAVEDRRFRSHFGIDPWGMARAALANWRAGEVVQGGSTLTQQLAKNLFLTPERNFRRKAQEALLALWLERRFSKDQLMEIYLNRVYLGAGAYGVDAASRLFFGVPARRLQLWQSALLAGLPKAPSRLNPRASPDLAVARASEVLEAMVANRAITQAQMEAELGRMRLPPPRSGQAGWFADWALEDLADTFPGNADLVLRATLDTRLQATVEARLGALLAGPGARAGVSQGAVVVLEAASGAVRAMAGGRDYQLSQFNRATLARRQPGSVFKPIYYLAALEHGMRPDDDVSDAPLNLGGWSPGNGTWRPRGEITLEEALAQSVNTAAVRVLYRAGGPKSAMEMAARLGIAGRFPNDASLALGTGEVTLIDLAAAYAAIANGGLRVTPFGIAGASAGGRGLPVVRAAPRRVLAAEPVAAMRRMLEAVVARGSGRAAALPGRAVAGKTGTTQDSRDAWFIGMVGGQVIGIWLGNDDARPMDDVRGGTLPARLFHEVAGALP
ncbi:transglycosylase domain-containing protein [Belnapia rosea]|uniref:Penicillin-binding protein 1A n=1 Tax=Belnapia rosea TaxID=938405 RepID=A0A1G7CC34_9PROT|nr:PBP1A family penicillin-binding protein [Belnapia rosea]SDB71225.1 penicillin-binding protein 1A [Belnapia rosea]SDE35945.1 penicillin-binding protein 1A [Belnapia rosea]